MAIAPISEKDQALTVKNVLAACKDIHKLNKRGYNFLYLASGFIAHYNLLGFIDYYEYNSLANDIKLYASMNQWNNFRPGEENYEYYMTKKAVYNKIIEGLTNG